MTNIKAACRTPRAVKLLLNRVRLYAMLLRYWTQSPGRESDTSVGTGRTEPSQEKRGAPSAELGSDLEASLVIFGILQKLCPDQVRTVLRDPDRGLFRLETIDKELAQFNERSLEAIRILASERYRTRFERLVQAIEIEDEVSHVFKDLNVAHGDTPAQPEKDDGVSNQGQEGLSKAGPRSAK